MTTVDPEKRGFDRLQKSDRARASKLTPAKPAAASSSAAAEAKADAAARRPADQPPPAGGRPAANVDTSGSNVDTSTATGRSAGGSNVDTKKVAALAGGKSNVDTEGRSAGGSNVDTRVVTDGGAGGDGELANGARATDQPANFTYDDFPASKPIFKPYAPKRQGNEPPPPSPKRATFDDVKRSAADRLVEANDPVVLGSAKGVTRTESTRQQYDKRGRQLEERFHREKDIPSGTPLAPMEFATWFLSLRPDLKPSTWRYYKQAAVFHLTRIQSSDAEEAIAHIEGETRWDSEMDLQSVRAAGKKAKAGGRVASANKAQFFDYEDWQRLDAYLRMRSWSKYTGFLRNWLRAGLATGLRPDEWRSTTIMVHEASTGDRIYLFVANAKATNGRGNGAVRSIDITDFSEETKLAIEQMSADGARWEADGEFDSVQNQVAQTLYRADNALWPNRKTRTYALYSCRHQFILNHRSLGVAEENLSAMLGHMVTDTQLTHYGRRGKGWSPDKIIDIALAHPTEAATVKKRLDAHVVRRQINEMINVKRRPTRGPKVGDDESGEAGEDLGGMGMDEI